ncbi:hypothetical protein G6M50_06605 [Agrobacterium rhizogenes]|nr:hypothetical protein [Rhizobium rhizogenes]NTJ77473.1 hypothetical protein [Rhizobium rhizogenes]
MAEHTHEIIDTHAEVQQHTATAVELHPPETETGVASFTDTNVDEGKTPAPVSAFVWDTWSRTRRVLGQDSQREFEGSRAKLKEAAAMLAIEIANRPDYDWAGEAADLMLDVPNSGHTCMPATAATFGAHASDDKAKKARSSFLDRTALAVEWLVAQVKAKSASYPADETGTEALVTLIDNNGGMSKIAGLQRDLNSRQEKPATRTAKITLDPQVVRSERLERARKQLERNAPSETAVVKLGLIYEDGSSKSVGATLAATDDLLEQALLDMNVVDPLIDRLGELVQAGQMVAENETTVLVDPLDDPEDPEEGFRKAFRHFVFSDEQPIVISPILSSSSVIVRAVPVAPIFDRSLGSTCHLRTRERRIMEANIADPERRKVFSAEIDGPGDTEGVCRFVVTTEAASDKADNGRNVGVLVEPLRSAQGNLPLAIDFARFTPRIEGHISLTAWRSRHNDFVAKATKPTGKSAEARQKHSLSATSWKIASSKKDDERDMVGNGVATDVEVMTGDFYRVSQVITALPVVGQITVRAERHTGLCIAFSTKHFSYEVYIPAVTTGGDRTTALVAPFKLPDSE